MQVLGVRASLCACLCASVLASVRAFVCVRACVRACVFACVRPCVRVKVRNCWLLFPLMRFQVLRYPCTIPSSQSRKKVGKVANYEEDQKRRKYATLTPSYAFAPICIETLGAWGDSAKDLVRKLEQESVRRQESRGQHPSSFRDWH